MNYTKLTKLCKTDETMEHIHQMRKAISNVLYQTVIDIEDVLNVYNPLTDRRILKCVQKRIPCSELVSFEQFCGDDNISIDTNNAGIFVDFALRNKSIGSLNSKLHLQDSGRNFLQNLKSLADISRRKLESLESLDKDNKIISKAKDKKALLGGRADPQAYERTYNKKTLEYLLLRKGAQDFYLTHLKNMNRKMVNTTIERVKRAPLVLETARQNFNSFKEKTLEEVEKQKELFKEKTKLVVAEEEALRKDREKEENSLFIIIDRYDSEIGERLPTYNDLVAKKEIYVQNLAILKKKVREQIQASEKAIETEKQWELEDLEKQLNKLKLMIAKRFLQIVLTAYVTSWRQHRVETMKKT